MKIGKKYIPPLVLLMVSISVATAVALPIFQQSNSGVPIKGVTPRCRELTPNTPGVLPGSSGAVIFDCSAIEFGTNAPAFDVQAPTTMTPSYGFPSGYSGCFGLTPTSSPPYSAGAFVPGAFCIIPAPAANAADGQNGHDLVAAPGATCNFIAQSFTPAANAYVIPTNPPTAFPFKAAGSWDYCVEYTNAPPTGSMGSFTISWS